MQTRILLGSLILCLSLTACGGSSTPTPTLDPNVVTINLTTNPDQPTSGQVELIVALADGTGKPLDDATVNILASHKTMSGMDMQGEATAQGNGRYAITAKFSMAGQWLVTVEAQRADSTVTRQNFNLVLK